MVSRTSRRPGPDLVVNLEAERFGANVSIAHLAQYSFAETAAASLTAYKAISILRADWWWELESIIACDRVGVDVLFRDGSELRIATLGLYGKPVDAHWRAAVRA